MTDELVNTLPYSVRQRFREAVAEFAESHPELSVPDCARAFVQGLMDDDLDLVKDLITQDAQTIVATLMRREISETRKGVMVGLDLPKASSPNSPGLRIAGRVLQPVSDSLYERIEGWREYAPNLNRHSTIMEMRREDLLSSADYDQQRADKFALKMLFKRELAGELGETETVADHFTTEQIYTRLTDIRHRLTTGQLRVKLGATTDRLKLNGRT